MKSRSIYLALPMFVVSSFIQGADVAYNIQAMQGPKLKHYVLAVEERDVAGQDRNSSNAPKFLESMRNVYDASNILLEDLKPLVQDITAKRERVKSLNQKVDTHVAEVLSDKQLLARTVGLLNWAREGFYATTSNPSEHAVNFISQEVNRTCKGISFSTYAQQAELVHSSYSWITRPSIPAELTLMLQDTKVHQDAEGAYEDKENSLDEMQRLALVMKEKERRIDSEFKSSVQHIVSAMQKLCLAKSAEMYQISADMHEIKETNAKLNELQVAAERVLLYLVQDYKDKKVPTNQLIMEITACSPETAALLAQQVDYYNNAANYTLPAAPVATEVVGEQASAKE